MRKLIALSSLLFVVGCPKSAPPSNDAPSYDPATSIVVKLRGEISKDKIVVNCERGEKSEFAFDGKKAIATNTSGTCNVYFMPGGTDTTLELSTGNTYSCGDSSGSIRCQPAN